MYASSLEDDMANCTDVSLKLSWELACRCALFCVFKLHH